MITLAWGLTTHLILPGLSIFTLALTYAFIKEKTG